MKRSTEDRESESEEQEHEEEEERGEEEEEEEDDDEEEESPAKLARGNGDGDAPVFTEFKAGYRLTIDSWERDLHYEYTFIQEGYTKEQVEFIIAFCDLFRRRTKFANLYEPSQTVVNDLMKTLAKLIVSHQPASYSVVKDFGIDEELVNAALQEENFDEFSQCFSEDWSPHFFSIGDPNFPRFTRVVDRIKVEYIPETIRIEDVSKQFGQSNRYY